MSSEHLSTERAGTLGALALGTDLAQAGDPRHRARRPRRREPAGAWRVRPGRRPPHRGARACTAASRVPCTAASAPGWARSRPGFSAPTAPASAPRLEESPRGRFVVSALNGLFGDRIRDAHPELAITMAVRRRGHDVALDTESLRAAFPEATGDLVVFLHGLSETESYWDRRSARDRGQLRRAAGRAGLEPGLPARELRAHAQRERRRDGRADGRPGRRVAGRGPPDRARRATRWAG